MRTQILPNDLIACGKTFDQSMAGFRREHVLSEVVALRNGEGGSECSCVLGRVSLLYCISEGLGEVGPALAGLPKRMEGVWLAKVLLCCLQPEI